MVNFILSDFLSLLGVPHTADYTNRRFDSMPFQSLFGLKKLLQEYHVDSEGLFFTDKSEVTALPTPFLAHTPKGFVIVTHVTSDTVDYMTQGQRQQIPLDRFLQAFDGNAFLAFPSPDSVEPDYAAHTRVIFIKKAKNVLLIALAVALFAYLFISNGIYRHVSTVLLTVFDMLGLYFTYLLVQKSARIHNPAADRVCKVLQEGGCDSVLKTKASTFFGIFSWSEVGFTYFSVSLLTLLIFPQWINYLAACNILCLPFTVWSISYQKFVAKAWCTLCVSVQCLLWILFFCYLGGGWIRDIFPLRLEFFVLGATYVFVLLALNKIMPHFENQDDDETEANSASRA